MRARSGTRPVCGSACSQKYRKDRCCRSLRNDCAATLPQRKNRHKKAQKAQEKTFELFVRFCGLANVQLCFEDIDGIGSNHHAELARLNHVTHLTIPESEMLRAQHKLDAPLLTRL